VAIDLKTKTAVVVGGGTGIGLSIARSLAGAGAKVAIGGRREDVLKQAVSGTDIQWHIVDVGDRQQVNAFFVWATQQLGHIDIMVNAAGINIKERSMQLMDPEQWDHVLNINATGAYNCLHAVLPGMKARQSGTIVNVSSVAGKRAIALGGVAYSASKFAMTALSTCVANEVAADGIRLTNLYPGEVNTPILEHRPTPVSDEHRQRILQPDEVAELVLSIVALPPSVHVPEFIIKPLSQPWY
jgi:NADP-dependent 3-hydroxy acid dehydrogenase YdfG